MSDNKERAPEAVPLSFEEPAPDTVRSPEVIKCFCASCVAQRAELSELAELVAP